MKIAKVCHTVKKKWLRDSKSIEYLKVKLQINFKNLLSWETHWPTKRRQCASACVPKLYIQTTHWKLTKYICICTWRQFNNELKNQNKPTCECRLLGKTRNSPHNELYNSKKTTTLTENFQINSSVARLRRISYILEVLKYNVLLRC